MRSKELEELQEEAQAAYHQGDYSATVSVLERVIEVGVIFCNERSTRTFIHVVGLDRTRL